MKRRRAIAGLCMLLCALLVSAIAAESASAVTKGTTGFTCVKGQSPADLWGEHCLGSNPGDGAKQEYGHKEVAENLKTEGKVTNERTANGTTESTPAFLSTVIGGVAIKLKAGSTFAEGWGENRKDPTTGEHYALGEGHTIYTEVAVVEPANCKVTSALGEGKLETNQLVATSKGQGDFGKLQPAVGETFATFNIVKSGTEPCAAEAKGIQIVGSVKCAPGGATIVCTEATITAEGTLRFGGKFGSKVGLELKTTGTGRANPESPYVPAAPTTVETP